jgi:hypothetical protein
MNPNMNPTKLIATIIGTTVIAVSGTYTFTENQVGMIEDELASTTVALGAQKALKIDMGKNFIYSQITSGRVPTFSGDFDSTDVSLSYVLAYYEKAGTEAGDILMERLRKGEEINITKELELLAKEKGEMLTCTK